MKRILSQRIGALILTMAISLSLVSPCVSYAVEDGCPLQEHQHTNECYKLPDSRRLNCSVTAHSHAPECYDGAGALVCGCSDKIIHMHDENCYDEDGELVCCLPEYEAHTHTEDCYEESKVLVCQEADAPVIPHEHTESCYEAQEKCVCGQEDDETHIHTDECFQTERVLVCTEEEATQPHIHTDACYEMHRTLVCDKNDLVPHTHTAECRDINGRYICEMLETITHQHDDSCFAIEEGGMSETHLCGIEEHVHSDICQKKKDDFEFGDNRPGDGEESSGFDAEDGSNNTKEDVDSTENDSEFDTDNKINGEKEDNFVEFEHNDRNNENDDELSIKDAANSESIFGSEENAFIYQDGLMENSDIIDGFGDCTWVFPSGIEVDSETNALRVDKTDMRFVNINVVVNLGSSSHAAGGITIELPYNLGIGRNGKTDVCNYYTVSGPGSFSAEIDETNNKVILKNNAAVSAGQHNSLSVIYHIDCWYITSGKTFTAEYTISSVSGTLPAVSIVTDSNISFTNTLNYYNPFVGVEGGGLYAQSYNPAFESAFGISRDEWDDKNYYYDIMTVCVQPKGQQAYDVGIEFVPGRYPTQTGGNQRPYGWDGELIGAMYTSNSDHGISPINVPAYDTAVYDNLPNCDTQVEHQTNIDRAKSHTWRSYKLSIPADKIGVVSDLVDSTDSYDSYSVYFLVRYPKPVNGIGSILYNGSASQSGYMILNGSVQITHTLLDSNKEVSEFRQAQLYFGLADEVDYDGNIYAATYVDTGCTAESASGLSALSSGRTVSLKLSGDWFCLNENRTNGNAVADGYTPWELNAIVDAALLSHTGSDGSSATRLKEGDYRIARYGITIVDDFGANSENSDGTWNIAWPQISVNSVINRGDGDAPVYVYGSESLFSNDWELLETFTLQDVYATDYYRSVHDQTKHSIAANKNYIRLKVSYPDSKLTTAIRIGYDVELLPDGPNIEAAVGSATDSLLLTSWLGYTAYAKGASVPDLQTDRNAISGDTAGVVRTDDASHPYLGYNSSIYPYRDVFQSKLLRSNDDVGMTATQGLLDSAGNLIGDGSNWTDAYTLRTETVGTGLSKVCYRFHGFTTNYSSDTVNMSEILSQRNSDLESGIESPYTSTNQRYYILLPAGLEYEEGSLKSGNSHPGMWGWISNISQLKVGIRGTINPTGVTSDSWQGLRYSSDITIKLEWIGNRQLLIIDRDMSRNVSAGKPIWLLSCLIPGNWSNETKVALWGQGISFNAISRKDFDGNAVELPSGSYETLVAHQFLSGNPSKGSVHAIELDNYGGESYSSAEEAFGPAGRLIDSYIIDSGSQNLTAISSLFRHTSGFGGSMANVKVSSGNPGPNAVYGDVAHTEIADGIYHYALTYEAMDGLSSDVVLWDSIEDYDRNGVSSQWRGIPTGVDTNNTGAKVYVHDTSMDLEAYVGGSDGRGYEYLLDSSSGWKLADASTDWSSVKSVAFWFDKTTFDSTGEKGPKSVTVYLKMKAPSFVSGSDVMTAYNEILFSDIHEQTNVRGTVLTNAVSVDLVPRDNTIPELPEAGGNGTGLYIVMGSSITLLSAFILIRRRKRT